MRKLNNEWKNLKVGDLVFSYFKGLWVIKEIHPRNDEYATTPLVTLEKIATRNGARCAKKEEQCDILWCSLATEAFLDYCKANGVDIEGVQSNRGRK